LSTPYHRNTDVPHHKKVKRRSIREAAVKVYLVEMALSFLAEGKNRFERAALGFPKRSVEIIVQRERLTDYIYCISRGICSRRKFVYHPDLQITKDDSIPVVSSVIVNKQNVATCVL